MSKVYNTCLRLNEKYTLKLSDEEIRESCLESNTAYLNSIKITQCMARWILTKITQCCCFLFFFKEQCDAGAEAIHGLTFRRFHRN